MITRRKLLEGLGAAAASAAAATTATTITGCQKAAGGGEPQATRDAAPKKGGGGVDWAAVRRDFLYPSDIGYFNTGTLGATPRPVVEAVKTSLEAIEATLPLWDFRDKDGEAAPLSGYRPLWDYRRPIAAIMGADAEEIALLQNATIGMNVAANGLDLKEGDEVLISDQEHPGGESPWLLLAERRKIVVKKVKIGAPWPSGADEVVARFEAAITPRTRVLVASHLTSAFGVLLPAAGLCELAKRRGILSVIDGAQVLGQLRVDVAKIGCDIYVASPHKWLCAPKGTGVLFVRKGIQRDLWTTLASTWWNDKEKNAGRLHQYGTGSISVLEGLKAAVAYVNRIGLDAIEARDLALTRRLREGLKEIRRVRLVSPESAELCASVTNFRVEGMTPADLQDSLWDKRLRVRHMGDGVRCGTHFYCAEEEIERLLARVREIAS